MLDSAGKKLLDDGELHHTLTLHSSQKNPHIASGHNIGGGDIDHRN
jgi:hypothetical protein